MLGQPGLSSCVQGKELGDLPLPYSKNMAKSEVWVWCVSLALKQCDYFFFAFYFEELYSCVGGGAVIFC